MYKTINKTIVNSPRDPMISACVIEDSINGNARLTSIEVVYPRVVHAEVLRHRVFSNTVSSSRATPIERIIEDCTYQPWEWRKNQHGMVAGDTLHGEDADRARGNWNIARDAAVLCAQTLADLGVHKQYANRLLEPFSYVRHLITATDWDNFFKLRISPDADPVVNEVAWIIRETMRRSEPVEREYHLPYILPEERHEYAIEQLIKSCSARCARLSYIRHDGKPTTIETDLDLYSRLRAPGHFSPMEHPAKRADPTARYANFTGWESHRHAIGE